MDANSTHCVGILGGGQLGRMLTIEAQRMGYKALQWTGGACSGSESCADFVLNKPFNDSEALAQFIQHCDYATVEFENVPHSLLSVIGDAMPCYPTATCIQICQDRELEKRFLRDHNITTTPFEIANTARELKSALLSISGAKIIKTAQFGYDGKGQKTVASAQDYDSEALFQSMGNVKCIVEQKVDLHGEISVIVVRSQTGEIVTYDPAENIHQEHILHLSIIPARFASKCLENARVIAAQIAQHLDYVGVLGVEFFVDQNGELLVNELAPRPHNSGHHTLDACISSQFEQQLRAIVNLPLARTDLLSPVVMLNLLGDVWKSVNTAPDWSPVFEISGAKLHLYGKRDAKQKRKMGHLSFISSTTETALKNAQLTHSLLQLKNF